MKRVELDGREMKIKLNTHCYIKKVMEFPSHYGQNLDALWDLLSTISVPTMIRIDHSEAIIENLGAYGEQLIEVFREAALENDSLWLELEYD
jgi:ribonuclease inhibitor